MNRLLIIVAILLCSASLHAAGINTKPDAVTDYFRAAQDSWKRKDMNAAITNARLSYLQKSDSYRLYWYMYFLSMEQRYDETIEVLEKTPETLWHPSVYETYIYRYFAEALKSRGRRAEAVAILIKAIDKKDKNPERNFIPLIRYWFKNPNLITQFREHPRYETVVREMIASMSNDWKSVDAGNREIVYSFCIVNAIVEMQKGNNSFADLCMQTAIDSTRIISETNEQHVHALFFRDAIKYWRGNSNQRTAGVYDFRFLCTYYRSIDADIERDGKLEHRTFTMSDDFLKNIIAENRDNAAVASVAYFYLFQGKVLMSFDYRIIEATIREVRDRHIVYETVDPDPGRMNFEAYNNYDGVMDFYDNAIPSQYLGGAKPLMFFPYSLYSANWRFRTFMLTGASYSVYIHEIFHNIENYYGIKPSHGYINENKKTWPAWYNDTVAREGVNAQFSYMQGIFGKEINPKGIDLIRLREVAPSGITFPVYERFVNASAAVPLENNRESGQLFLSGQEANTKKNFESAVVFYRKAYEVNPMNQQALRHYAYALYWNLKKKDEAVALYQKYLDSFEGLPFSQEAAIRVLWNAFWDKKDYASVLQLCDRYGMYMKDKENPTVLLFYHGVSLSRTEKYREALPFLEQALKNNIIWQDNLKIEIETCRKKLQ